MTKKGWTEVRVLVPAGWHELVADVLMAGGWSSVVFGRPSLGVDPAPDGLDWVRSFLSADEDSPQARKDLEARLRDLAERVGNDELRRLEPTFHELPPEDYANSWKKTWRPFRVGNLCVVTPDWPQPLRSTDTRLILEPGAAFGTGRHCTTRMCLSLLQERGATDARVLDAGSGSGILTVASALLGAQTALGFDLDPRGRAQGRELAEDNAVAQRCEFREGGFDVLTEADGTFDVVLANIYSDVVQQHAADLAARLKPGGWFAFSGCPDRHREPTEEAIVATGLKLEEVRQRGRWLTFNGKK